MALIAWIVLIIFIVWIKRNLTFVIGYVSHLGLDSGAFNNVRFMLVYVLCFRIVNGKNREGLLVIFERCFV